MEYNLLEDGLILGPLENGVRIPLPNVHAGYGPYDSLNDAKTALSTIFSGIGNVPRGYTFCVIEGDKPQEWWLTKKGDWDSKEKKNTSSSSSTTEVTGLILQRRGSYIAVSYDDGNTWTNLVALDDIRGYNGSDGQQGPQGPAGSSADLNKIKVLMTSTYIADDGTVHPFVVPCTEYKFYISYNGGTSKDVIGTIHVPVGGGEGEVSAPVIEIATYTDGNKYWKQNGEWMLDENGNMVRANGIDGQDGQDGTGTEVLSAFKSFVFKRTNDDISSIRPTGGTYSNPIATGWFDAPQQGPEQLWMSVKMFYSVESMNDDLINQWSLPTWATDTNDIDFEYSSAPADTLYDNMADPSVKPRFRIVAQDDPSQDVEIDADGWYDPVRHNELMDTACWMAMRKLNNGAPADEPVATHGWIILKIASENGGGGVAPTAHFKSYSYRRSNNYTYHVEEIEGVETTVYDLDPSEFPTGGDYNSPNPTNVDANDNLLWSDGIPGGEAKLWESTCIFHSNGTSNGWTTPRAISDTRYTDEEWAEENPTYPKPQRRSPDDNNPDYPSGREDDGWDDEPVPNKNYVYKAVRPVRDGQYVPGSDWTIIRIAGERGEDGTSVTIKGTLAAMYSSWDQAQADRSNRQNGDLIYVANDDPTTGGTNEVGVYQYNAAQNRYDKLSPEVGDGYMYHGHLWVWDGDSLVDVGEIQGPKGEPGTTYYLHIKYSNDPRVLTDPARAEFSGSRGEEPGDYIGTYTNTSSDPFSADSMDITKYKWQEWKGQDGFGYEYIFRLTSKTDVDSSGNPIAPSVPTIAQCIDYTYGNRIVTFQDDDYVPPFDGWTDDPQSPYKDKPYCWVAYRKKVDGVWTAFTGSSANNSRAALFSMYSSRGRGIASITEMYAVWNYGDQQHVPPLGSFSQTIPDFNEAQGLIYLWNYEIVSYDDGTPNSSTDPICIGQWKEGKGIGRVVEYYYASQIGPDENGMPTSSSAYPPAVALPSEGQGGWSKIPSRVDKNKPYLWNYEVVWYDDDTVCNITTPACIAYYIYTDIEYLLNIFKKVEGDSNTAYLGGIVGVVEKNSQNNDEIRAMLNATTLGSNSEHGKLFIASGFKGTSDVNNATFKVYEDGHVAMRSAEIQGYLTQHFRRVHDVENYLVEVGNGTQSRYLDRSKLSNAILLGWNTLSFSENGTTVDFSDNYEVTLSTYLGSSNAGRVLFSNQFYISSNGTMFSNNNYGKTLLDGYFILPNGAITEGHFGVALYGGWVETIKISAIDEEMQLINPQLTSMDNLYLITGWGGSVRFAYMEDLPNVNANQAVVNNEAIGFNVDYARRKSVGINSEVNICRLTEFNRTVFIKGSSSASTLYLIVPVFRTDTWYDKQDIQVQYDILLNENHREIILKQELPGTNTPDAEVQNLPNIQLIGNGALTINAHESGVAANYGVGLRLTYISEVGGTNIHGWIAERITQINSL